MTDGRHVRPQVPGVTIWMSLLGAACVVMAAVADSGALSLALIAVGACLVAGAAAWSVSTVGSLTTKLRANEGLRRRQVEALRAELAALHGRVVLLELDIVQAEAERDTARSRFEDLLSRPVARPAEIASTAFRLPLVRAAFGPPQRQEVATDMGSDTARTEITLGNGTVVAARVVHAPLVAVERQAAEGDARVA